MGYTAEISCISSSASLLSINLDTEAARARAEGAGESAQVKAGENTHPYPPAAMAAPPLP